MVGADGWSRGILPHFTAVDAPPSPPAKPLETVFRWIEI